MVQLIMLLAALQLAYNLIFKPRYDSCQCGIFGQSTNNPKKLNQSNVKILGMFNESRGKHSCGITYDGEIYHGLMQEKLFTDFMKGRTFVAEHNPLMFGHTRSASSGTVSEFNSHPFGFGTSANGGYKFIGVHNGTLYNHEQLARDYGVTVTTKYKDNKDVETIRTKIDSEILLEIIYKTRNFKVLSEYIGKAALIWTDTDQPNITYLWSGKSRHSEHYVAAAEVEERPMNVWVESKNNFYFSSLPEALHAIGALPTQVNQIDYNTVYVVKNGDFENAKKHILSRKQCFQTETYVPKSYTNHNHNACGYTSGKLNEVSAEGDDWEDHRQTSTTRSNIKEIIANSAKVKEEPNIFNDLPALDQNEYGNKVYNFKFRYHQKGHLINGIYCYVTNYGFVKLDENEIQAEKIYERNRGLRFVNGYFIEDKTKLEGIVPFPHGKSTPIYYYFVSGVMVKTLLDYKVASGVDYIASDFKRLSHMSCQPVMDITFNFKRSSFQEIFKDGKLFTGVVNGLSYEKIYTISGGNLVNVEFKEKGNSSNTTKIIQEQKEKLATQLSLVLPRNSEEKFNPIIMTTSKQDIEALEAEIEREELINTQIQNLMDIEDAAEEDEDETTAAIVLDMIDKEITPCLMSFQNCREELEHLSSTHDSVIAAKELVHELIQLINNFTK